MGLRLLPVAAAAGPITVPWAQVAAVLPPGPGRAPCPGGCGRHGRPPGRGGWGNDRSPRGLRAHLRAADVGLRPGELWETDFEWRVGGLKTGGGWEIGGCGGCGGFYSYADC